MDIRFSAPIASALAAALITVFTAATGGNGVKLDMKADATKICYANGCKPRV